MSKYVEGCFCLWCHHPMIEGPDDGYDDGPICPIDGMGSRYYPIDGKPYRPWKPKLEVVK